MPKILVFAGPNGSGKSTVTSGFGIVGEYVNADVIQKNLKCDALTAAQIAQATREHLVSKGLDFTFESVMSTTRNIDLLESAKSKGYSIECVYVLTVSPDINMRRVRFRVKNGGHDVPVDKVFIRYRRALSLIPRLLHVCDKIRIFDNSLDFKTNENLIVEADSCSTVIYPNEIWSENMIISLLSGNYPEEYLNDSTERFN